MKNDRSGAVSQAINGCAVHNSGQMCLFQGKNSRDFRAFTTSVLKEVNSQWKVIHEHLSSLPE